MLNNRNSGLNAGLNAKYYTTGDAVTMECSLGVGSDGSVPSETSWYVLSLATMCSVVINHVFSR